jgi:DNA-binding transcriptional ArsR family regulator
MSALTSKDEQATREGTAGEPPASEREEASDHPDRDQIELAAVLHALSDPVRLQIVATVADGREWTCGSLELPVSKSTCTHHFRVLREAGVIRQRIVGTTKLNSLRREDLDELFPGLLDAVVAGAASSAFPGAACTRD